MSGFHRLHALRMENDATGFTMDEMRPRFAALANRHENGTAPHAVVAFQLFQTPPAIAAQMVSLLALTGGERVLEPSAGLGRLLDALPNDLDVVAVESAPQCAGELFKQNRERVMIKQRDFLETTPRELGLFDAVVMNPPFHLRSDIHHIRHALTFLRPGGSLVALCLNTCHRHEAFKASAVEWIELPETTFAKEGTRVSTVILKITTP